MISVFWKIVKYFKIFDYLKNHAALIFNIILTFSYKSHTMKTLFAVFGKFAILFAFKIKQGKR